MDAEARRARIVGAITALVHAAPELDATVIGGLVDDLRAFATPLALAIARIVELVEEQLVDPGVALPALAMACDTLVRSHDAVALAAAHHAVESLTPTPDLDLIPAATLSRGPRSRT